MFSFVVSWLYFHLIMLLLEDDFHIDHAELLLCDYCEGRPWPKVSIAFNPSLTSTKRMVPVLKYLSLNKYLSLKDKNENKYVRDISSIAICLEA